MYARFIPECLRLFELSDIDICKLELFTISSFKVEGFSYKVPIAEFSAWNICLHQTSTGWAMTAFGERWQVTAAVRGCRDNVITGWKNHLVQQAAPTAWQSMALMVSAMEKLVLGFFMMYNWHSKSPGSWNGRARHYDLFSPHCSLFVQYAKVQMGTNPWETTLPGSFGEEASSSYRGWH